MIEKFLEFVPEERPMAVLVCGNVGTGKTKVALQLSRELGARHFNTDALRKELLPEPKYTSEETAKNYVELLERAIKLLKQGRSVILDGTYDKTQFRQDVYRALNKHGVSFVVFCITAPEDVIKARLEKKKAQPEPNNPSDAKFDIYLLKKKKMETDPAYSHPLADKDVKVIEFDTNSGKVVRKNF